MLLKSRITRVASEHLRLKVSSRVHNFVREKGRREEGL